MLLSEDNEVKSFERPKEKIKQYRFSDLKIVKVSEKNTKGLKKIMERQWHRSDNFYQFVFETSRTGFFHKFHTKPFTITGNKLKIGNDEHEDIKFMDNMLVIGDGEYNTFELDTNIVFLQHILNIILALIFSLSWGIIGSIIGKPFQNLESIKDISIDLILSLFSTPASQVLGGFLFLSGLGLHLSFIEYERDLTDDEDRNF